MPEVKWIELARADLLAIVDYISDDNPDAAQRVKDDIEAKAKKLIDFPKMGRPGRVEGTRELIAWANYIIVYQENTSTIRILRGCMRRNNGHHPIELLPFLKYNG